MHVPPLLQSLLPPPPHCRLLALALVLMAVALDLRPFRALTLVRARSPPSASGAAAASVAAEVEGGAADKAAFP